MSESFFRVGTTADGARTGTGTAWSTPDNILGASVDYQWAQCTQTVTAGDSDGLAMSNPDFSAVPALAIIDGIEVRAASYIQIVAGDPVTWVDCQLILADGSDSAATDTVAGWNIWSGNYSYVTGGGPSDLWGETGLTGADINDVDWGFWITVNLPLIDDLARIDQMSMKVYYTIVTITDVNTTESWTDGDTGLVITGTTFL